MLEGAYPDGELVGIREWRTFMRIYNAVLAHCHGIDLDVLRYAFGSA